MKPFDVLYRKIVLGVIVIAVMFSRVTFANTDTVTGEVMQLKLESSNVIEILLYPDDAFALPTSCNGVIMFDYASDTASEVYYMALLAAKSAKREVSIRYLESQSPAMCTLLNVVLEES